MQAIFETLFDIVYLVTVITLSIRMIRGSQVRKQFLLYGIMTAVWVLALARIALCLFPQNAWASAEAPLCWGIFRNIPFAILGGRIVVPFYRSAKEKQDRPFRRWGFP